MEKRAKKSILGIIPARGGSKRLPGKNIKDFLGKPLISWSIETALASGIFDELVLMTDSQEIADIGKKCGVPKVFILPPELASDSAYVGDAVKHMIENFKKDGATYEIFFLIEPTAPGRRAFHFKEAAGLICTHDDLDAVLGITEIPANKGPHKALAIDDKGFVRRASDGASIRDLKHLNQTIPKTYYINSGLFAFRTANFDKGNMWGDNSSGYIMEEKYSFDINTPEDWEISKFKMEKILKENV